MKIIELKNNKTLLKEYVKLCNLEWGTKKSLLEMNLYIEKKVNKILEDDKVISVQALVNNDELIGFISLFKYDGDEKRDLTPWYATMFVKDKYRKKGYSKILNDAIIKKAKELKYSKVYLKSNLVNYYEKIGAKYIENLNNGEKLYYIDLE
jgi:N-acetylglutamate synthase-like GNAT family acetyltransferase